MLGSRRVAALPPPRADGPTDKPAATSTENLTPKAARARVRAARSGNNARRQREDERVAHGADDQDGGVGAAAAGVDEHENQPNGDKTNETCSSRSRIKQPRAKSPHVSSVKTKSGSWTPKSRLLDRSSASGPGPRDRSNKPVVPVPYHHARPSRSRVKAASTAAASPGDLLRKRAASKDRRELSTSARIAAAEIQRRKQHSKSPSRHNTTHTASPRRKATATVRRGRSLTRVSSRHKRMSSEVDQLNSTTSSSTSTTSTTSSTTTSNSSNGSENPTALTRSSDKGLGSTGNGRKENILNGRRRDSTIKSRSGRRTAGGQVEQRNHDEDEGTTGEQDNGTPQDKGTLYSSTLFNKVNDTVRMSERRHNLARARKAELEQPSKKRLSLTLRPRASPSSPGAQTTATIATMTDTDHHDDHNDPFAAMDLNGDGVVDRAEWEAAQSAAQNASPTTPTITTASTATATTTAKLDTHAKTAQSKVEVEPSSPSETFAPTLNTTAKPRRGASRASQRSRSAAPESTSTSTSTSTATTVSASQRPRRARSLTSVAAIRASARGNSTSSSTSTPANKLNEPEVTAPLPRPRRAHSSTGVSSRQTPAVPAPRPRQPTRRPSWSSVVARSTTKSKSPSRSRSPSSRSRSTGRKTFELINTRNSKVASTKTLRRGLSSTRQHNAASASPTEARPRRTMSSVAMIRRGVGTPQPPPEPKPDQRTNLRTRWRDYAEIDDDKKAVTTENGPREEEEAAAADTTSCQTEERDKDHVADDLNTGTSPGTGTDTAASVSTTSPAVRRRPSFIRRPSTSQANLTSNDSSVLAPAAPNSLPRRSTVCAHEPECPGVPAPSVRRLASTTSVAADKAKPQPSVRRVPSCATQSGSRRRLSSVANTRPAAAKAATNPPIRRRVSNTRYPTIAERMAARAAAPASNKAVQRRPSAIKRHNVDVLNRVANRHSMSARHGPTVRRQPSQAVKPQRRPPSYAAAGKPLGMRRSGSRPAMVPRLDLTAAHDARKEEELEEADETEQDDSDDLEEAVKLSRRSATKLSERSRQETEELAELEAQVQRETDALAEKESHVAEQSAAEERQRQADERAALLAKTLKEEAKMREEQEREQQEIEQAESQREADEMKEQEAQVLAELAEQRHREEKRLRQQREEDAARMEKTEAIRIRAEKRARAAEERRAREETRKAKALELKAMEEQRMAQKQKRDNEEAARQAALAVVEAAAQERIDSRGGVKRKSIDDVHTQPKRKSLGNHGAIIVNSSPRIRLTPTQRSPVIDRHASPLSPQQFHERSQEVVSSKAIVATTPQTPPKMPADCCLAKKFRSPLKAISPNSEKYLRQLVGVNDLYGTGADNECNSEAEEDWAHKVDLEAMFDSLGDSPGTQDQLHAVAKELREGAAELNQAVDSLDESTSSVWSMLFPVGYTAWESHPAYEDVYGDLQQEDLALNA